MFIEEVVQKAGEDAYTTGRKYSEYPKGLSCEELELWKYGYDMACSVDISLGDFNN